MNGWIAMDSDGKSGELSIIGVFETEDLAKLGIANHVLENDVDTDYLELFEIVNGVPVRGVRK